MQRRTLAAAAGLAGGVLLLVLALAAGPAASSRNTTAAAGPRQGGTLRLNLSTTDFQFTDPALEYEVNGWQLEYATALKLVNWRESKAQLYPEAARAFPRIGLGGRRYTFTIRKGLRLSNGERIRAANFKRGFARALTPKMNSPAIAFLGDVKSVVSRGNYTLVINLKRPRPGFVSIVSMPFFQAVPKNLAIDPKGVHTYASGGPYYVAARDVGRSVVLKRNKYYRGSRPHNPNVMSITVNTNIDTSLLQVEANQRDYDMFGLPPTSHVMLHRKYPKRYHVDPGVITDLLTMNVTYGSAGEGIKNKSCFNGYSGAGLRTRKAVNYAVNRPATLAARGAFAGTPTNQLLPPTMPGFHKWTKQIGYPLSRPNLAKARSLRPKRCDITFYAANSPTGSAQAQIVKDNLSKIGLNASIKLFPFAVRITKEGHRGEPFDLDLQAWGADYPDPVDFIDILANGNNIHAENNNNNAYFNSKAFNRRMEQAGRISNLPKRYAAWALLDRDLMKEQAPYAPLFFRTVRSFTSNRVGCYSYQPVYAVPNLNTFCIKR
ncbi:MAG TPA: ABC transporter substrate-binding protein [Gaiellaceae bacterium]|nr:ABC transporter substrate-binding protein [Gaiellaceae bacterium]